jgi:pilus assembly protein CpaF
MSLSDRLKQPTSLSSSGRPVPSYAPAPGEVDVFQDTKMELHKALVDRLDFQAIEQLAPSQLQEELRVILADLLDHREVPVPLNRVERERLIAEVINEITGLGPLEPLLADPTLSDILVNTYSTVYVERRGKLERVPVRFRDNQHLLHIISRIVAKVGRRIDEGSPMVDARLPDGSRVNAVIPPVAVDGPLLSIRRFGATPLRIGDLVANDSITPSMVDFLAGCVQAKMNILIVGGTGSGKTTLLNVLSSLIPPTERIVTIEDAAELQLQQPHVCRLEVRPSNIENRGEITQRDLVRNSLRMRPDRIIIGEVRGSEVLDMLQAMNTGHEGSMTTVHANTPRDALTRLNAMINMAEVSFTDQIIAQMVSRALHVIVHLARFSDGKRRLAAISEITGTEGSTITMHDVFVFQQTGIGEDGTIVGRYAAVGTPRCLEKIALAGVRLDPAIFARTPADRRG